MNAKRFVKLSILAAALAVAAGSAVAAGGQAITRAEMKATVLRARAHGELIPAGQAIQPFAAPSTGAQRSRQDVRNEVLQARASGELVPAGQGMSFDVPTGSMLARAEVKESVREARMRGELIPAGEAIGAVEWQARAHTTRGASFAANTRR